MTFTSCLAAVLVVISILYYFISRNYKYWKLKNVQSFPSSVLWGSFKDVALQRVSMGEFLKDIYSRTTGPYSGFYAFHKPCLLLKDPAIIKSILVSDFASFSERGMANDVEGDPIGSCNLFMMRNPEWKAMRQKLTPLFTSGKMKTMFGLMMEVGDDLIRHIDAKEPSVVNAKQTAMKYTIEVITTCVFGLKSNCLNDENDQFLLQGNKIFDFTFFRAVQMASFFYAPDTLVRLAKFKFFHPDVEVFLRDVFIQTIRHRETVSSQRPDLIETLIELKKNDPSFSEDRLVAQAAVFLAAGFESSSSVISFTLHHLAHQPDIQKKLQLEIKTVLSKGPLTYDAMNKMEYLDMVVSETLRMYPPLPQLNRECTKHSKLPGSDLVIERGTKLYISLLGLHYDPKYFPDPDVYNPERFTKENRQKIPTGVYMPFGIGPHNCIGDRFGLMSSKIGLVRILGNFEVKKCNESLRIDMDPRSFLVTSKTGLPVHIARIPAA